MRKVLLFSFVLLTMMLTTSCSNDNIDDRLYSLKYGEIRDLEGTIHYDENIHYWYVSIKNTNGNEVTTRLYFSDSPSVTKYLVEGLVVIVSGEVFDFLRSVDVPYGTQYFGFEVESIQKNS